MKHFLIHELWILVAIIVVLTYVLDGGKFSVGTIVGATIGWFLPGIFQFLKKRFWD